MIKKNQNNILAIIPARSGSKGLVDKNIKQLNGHPLLSFSIMAAKKSKLIDKVILSTDSQKYADIAMKYGMEVPFLRPPEISRDDSIDNDFILHSLNWLERKRHISQIILFI